MILASSIVSSSIFGTLSREVSGKIRTSESPLQRATETRRSHRDMIVVDPEADLVARLDPQLIAELLRNDDLAFRPDSMSHTTEYNLLQTGARTVINTGTRVDGRSRSVIDPVERGSVWVGVGEWR